MKKIIFAAVMAAIMLVGCGPASSSSASATDSTTAVNAGGQNDFGVVCNGISIVPGNDFTAIKDSLPEAEKYFEAQSCYFDGLDKVFTYSEFEVTTYPLSAEKDNVQDVCIKSGDMKTAKGIGIGSSLDDVIAAYGENYKLNGKMYNYYLDDTKYVYFFVMNNVVKYYGYAITVTN